MLKNRTVFHRYFMTVFLRCPIYTDDGDNMKLTELKDGECARITKIHNIDQDRKRLFYIGLYEGVRIQRLLAAPMQDPCLYFVSGNQIVLRSQDADNIEVEVE